MMTQKYAAPAPFEPALAKPALRVCAVIPTYRASATIVDVVAQALAYADCVVVVDDACPDSSGQVVKNCYSGDGRVVVTVHPRNGGVGAATKTGIGLALETGADIIVKLDADGQMDPAFIDQIRDVFSDEPSVACVKGNRFFDADVVSIMPKTRLIGNAGLSLLAKFASGYWNIIDPTNGYLAFNARILKMLPWRTFADSYFFEMSVLCEFGLKRLPIVELEMPTIYNESPSSLSITRTLFEFPPKLWRMMLRRLLIQYFIFDVNLGTLYFVFGSLLLMFGLIFGGIQWTESIVTHVGRATGTVMLAVLPFLMGFQLVLNALMYDVQFSQKTHHELGVDSARRSLKAPQF